MERRIAQLDELWGWRADDVLVLALPLFHVHGLGIGVDGARDMVSASEVSQPKRLRE